MSEVLFEWQAPPPYRDLILSLVADPGRSLEGDRHGAVDAVCGYHRMASQIWARYGAANVPSVTRRPTISLVVSGYWATAPGALGEKALGVLKQTREGL